MVSSQQYKLFIFIRNRIVHFGKAPTFTEMKEFMQVTSNQTVVDWLSILEREKYILRNKGKFRGITIANKGTQGFNENIQLQDNRAIKKSFAPTHIDTTTNSNVFNISNVDKGINIRASNIIPTWKGGEKDGSS